MWNCVSQRVSDTPRQRRGFSAGRANGASQPNFLATAIISSSSDDNTVRSIHLDPRAASIVQAIKGLPPASVRFFPGRPFDPPLAVMTASIFLPSINGTMSPGRYWRNRNWPDQKTNFFLAVPTQRISVLLIIQRDAT